MKNKNTRICFISSSGGHYEQLKMLKPLAEKYTAIWITEKHIIKIELIIICCKPDQRISSSLLK